MKISDRVENEKLGIALLPDVPEVLGYRRACYAGTTNGHFVATFLRDLYL